MDTPKNFLSAGAWVGRQQAFALIGTKCAAARAQALKEIKKSRAYEQLGLTWPEFCETHAGICRESADALIRQIDEFGEEYFRLSQITPVSSETYRELKPKVEGDTVTIDGQEIPLTLPNAAKIRAAFRKMRDERNQARALVEDLGAHNAVISLSQRSDVLIEKARNLSYYYPPNSDRQELIDLANRAIEQWKKAAREFAS
jgi:hypothetical protein